MQVKIKKFLLDLFYPKFCFGCQKEGSYLCQDCLSILKISTSHQKYSTKNLVDLYFPTDYQNPLTKKLIQNFKYEPFIKELAENLSSLIINHFQLIDNLPAFSNFTIIPIPLEERKLKWRGFNQAEDIGKQISKFLNIPILNNILIKTKETLPQAELSAKERKENIKGVFSVKNKEIIKNKKIILVDDVYTTGSTMEECAKVLKMAGAKEIIGIVVARAKPEEDRL